ncbi:MAG: site-specific integrase [Acidimicrobiales bacterium]
MTRRGNSEGSIYQRSSDGRWLGAATVGLDPAGRPIRRTVSAKTRAEVVRKLKVLSREIDDGLVTAERAPTLEVLFERWFVDVMAREVVRSTIDNYRSIVKFHILPTLGRKKVDELTVAEVDRLLAAKIASGLSPSTVHRIRAVLSQCLDQGIRWGVTPRNVARLSRSPKLIRPEGRTLSPEQARGLLASLRGHRNEALYTLMLSTGMRRGEALGLKWGDVDLEGGVVRIRRSLKREGGHIVTADTKTLKSRRAVNLPEPVVELLARHRDQQEKQRVDLGAAWVETEFVFTSSIGTPIDPRNLYRDFQKVCESAGLSYWHPHELRHSAASLMLANGVKLQVVSQVLGHSSIRMTADVYGHILDPDREQAAKAMAAVLWEH